MKKTSTLIIVILLSVITGSFAQTQTGNDPMYNSLPKAKSSVVEQGSITEAGDHLIAASESYSLAKFTPAILGTAGAILIIKSDHDEIGYGVSAAGVLAAIYFGLRGDSQLKKAGRKLQLYSGNKGLGMSLKL
ncbi:hypothetical protein K3G39_04815 [Pontibacter sp. HSC-14F20]|uniref:hypothetical protein n=1 Tax=Pontibacter sp. HSC-14F20 TaxID=2864136 RepID=UPI001C72BC32|nr:hypothetical protein [Pontibacter sp. HSC-14F20]MBX0332554.1 hypothetical protein [Pontibacter sp. HSC-14F20]